jgi:nickel-dependent lactate racemase
MRISFPYPDMSPLEIPEKNLLGIFSPSTVSIEKSEDEIIEEALFHPVGSPPLSEILKGHRNVLIVVDDYTRTTPVQIILPRLIKELKKSGIGLGGIKILIALGTHRPMSQGEIAKKFGEEISRQYLILNHSWEDPSQLIHLGQTAKGTPIIVNRLAQETDL